MAPCNRARQSGIALLMAILVVVAATAISVSMIHDESFSIRKTSRLQLLDRASLYAVGLEDWAQIFLKRDRKDSKIDDLTEDWAVGVPGLPIEAGYLSGYMEDEQSRFNINSLLDDKDSVKRLTRLCDNLEVDPAFIPALLDWIDLDSDVRYPDGAEELYETYRIANRYMVDVSELLLVKDIKPEDYEKLRPFITALPSTSKLNVNTMSDTVFLMLDDDLDAKAFLEEREVEPFSSVQSFVDRMQIPVEAAGLSVSSEYFRAFGQVVQADLEYSFDTLIHRNTNGGTTIISRNLGQF